MTSAADIGAAGHHRCAHALVPVVRPTPPPLARASIHGAVTAVERVGDRYWVLRVAAPHIARTSLPGQFVMISIAAPDEPVIILPRPDRGVRRRPRRGNDRPVHRRRRRRHAPSGVARRRASSRRWSVRSGAAFRSAQSRGTCCWSVGASASAPSPSSHGPSRRARSGSRPSSSGRHGGALVGVGPTRVGTERSGDRHRRGRHERPVEHSRALAPRPHGDHPARHDRDVRVGSAARAVHRPRRAVGERPCTRRSRSTWRAASGYCHGCARSANGTDHEGSLVCTDGPVFEVDRRPAVNRGDARKPVGADFRPDDGDRGGQGVTHADHVCAHGLADGAGRSDVGKVVDEAAGGVDDSASAARVEAPRRGGDLTGLGAVPHDEHERMGQQLSGSTTPRPRWCSRPPRRRERNHSPRCAPRRAELARSATWACRPAIADRPDPAGRRRRVRGPHEDEDPLAVAIASSRNGRTLSRPKYGFTVRASASKAAGRPGPRPSEERGGVRRRCRRYVVALGISDDQQAGLVRELDLSRYACRPPIPSCS